MFGIGEQMREFLKQEEEEEEEMGWGAKEITKKYIGKLVEVEVWGVELVHGTRAEKPYLSSVYGDGKSYKDDLSRAQNLRWNSRENSWQE